MSYKYTKKLQYPARAFVNWQTVNESLRVRQRLALQKSRIAGFAVLFETNVLYIIYNAWGYKLPYSS